MILLIKKEKYVGKIQLEIIYILMILKIVQ